MAFAGTLIDQAKRWQTPSDLRLDDLRKLANIYGLDIWSSNGQWVLIRYGQNPWVEAPISNASTIDEIEKDLKFFINGTSVPGGILEYDPNKRGNPMTQQQVREQQEEKQEEQSEEQFPSAEGETPEKQESPTETTEVQVDVDQLQITLKETQEKLEAMNRDKSELEDSLAKRQQGDRGRELQRLRLSDLNSGMREVQGTLSVLTDAVGKIADSSGVEVDISSQLNRVREDTQRANQQELESIAEPIRQQIFEIGRELNVDVQNHPDFEIASLYYSEALRSNDPQYNLDKALEEAKRVRDKHLKPKEEPVQKASNNSRSQDLSVATPRGTGSPRRVSSKGEAAKAYNDGRISAEEFAKWR